jgi:hypothetical protein
MYENLGDDFVRQGQDGVPVRIEALLGNCLLDPQFGHSSLKVRDLSFEICDVSTVCFETGKHRGEVYRRQSCS